MTTSEYTYHPILIKPSGEVIRSSYGNAIGVYTTGRLTAICTKDPKSRLRVIQEILTLIAGVLGFFALLFIATVTTPFVTLCAILVYLAGSSILLYTVIYDPRIDASHMTEVSKKVAEYYNRQVDVCPSVAYLTSKYPEGH